MSVTKVIQPRLHAASGGLFANWMPTAYVEVGDFGVIDDHRFVRHGALHEYGEIARAERHKNARDNFEFKDRIELSTSTLAEASAGAGIRGTVSLRLSDRGAFLYHLANTATFRVNNTRQFQEQLAAVLLAGDLDFPPNGVVVTEILHAKKATVIVADQSEAQIELQTAFQPVGEAFLSGAKGSVQAGVTKGSLLQFVGHNDINAMLRLIRPKITPPPDGPSGPPAQAGLPERTVQWVRDLFRERQLKVSDLVIRSTGDANEPTVSIVVAKTGEEFLLTLHDLTVEEMRGDVADVVFAGAGFAPKTVQLPEIEELPISDRGRQTAS